jgi:hypothetical protein
MNVLSKRGIDTSLCSYGMRSGGKKLGNTGRVEASFSKTESCSQTRASSSNNDSVILVVDDGVFLGNEAGRFLCPQVLGCENACRWPCR